MTQANHKFLACVLGLLFTQGWGLAPVLADELPELRLTLEHGQFFPKDAVNPTLDREPADEVDTPRDLSWITGSLEFAPRHKIDFHYTNLAGA